MKWNSEEKYDLITMGVTLHYLPGEQTMSKVNETLNEDGIFAVFGYFPKTMYDREGKEREEYRAAFNRMMDNKIIPYFAFKYDELTNYYQVPKVYPFHKYFRYQIEVREIITKLSKEDFFGYFKSFVAYNLYVQSHDDDPLSEIEALIKGEDACLVEDHFCILCEKL